MNTFEFLDLPDKLNVFFYLRLYHGMTPLRSVRRAQEHEAVEI